MINYTKNTPKGKKKADRKFDWMFINTDMGRFLVVDSSYTEKAAIEFFQRYRPQEDPYASIDTNFIAFDVTTGNYKLVDEGAPGGFKVWTFYVD